jgi:hypothetical protein
MTGSVTRAGSVTRGRHFGGTGLTARTVRTVRGSARVHLAKLSVGAVLTVATVASLGLTGCTAARNALGTNSSPCYLALPVAKGAVYGRGTFGGVRLVTPEDLAKAHRVPSELEARAKGKLKDICVVEYRGSYRLDQVQKPIGRRPITGVGRYAIVVIARDTNKLIGTFVRGTLPVRFRHLALGVRWGPFGSASTGNFVPAET